MEDNKKAPQQDNSITNLQGNINLDISPNQASNSSPRFVLNAIRDSITGDKISYQSEPGTEEIYLLPEEFIHIGSIYAEDGIVYLFSTNGATDQIGFQKDDKYTQLVSAQFGFSKDYPILGEYRVFRGCERIIYWCDGNTPDKFFNIDKPENFKDNFGNWDINLFRLEPDILPIDIDVEAVSESGGTLPAGMYFAQIEVLDRGLNVIYRTGISQGVAIYADTTSANYSSIQGNFNYPQVAPAGGGKPVSNKSILYTFSNIDIRFQYLRLNIIKATGGNGNSIKAFTKSDLIPISRSSVSYLFTGLDDMDTIEDISKFIVPLSNYISSEDMEQVDNRLVRINVKETKRDYSKYQKFASKIGTRYKVEEVPANDPTAVGNPKNPLTPFYKMSGMGDEVVALGIVYVHSDGSESPQFHIPGICKDFKLANPINDAQKCIRVTTQLAFNNPDDFPLDFYSISARVTYTVNGEEFTHEYIVSGIIGIPFIYTVPPCFRPIDDVVVTNLELLTEPNIFNYIQVQTLTSEVVLTGSGNSNTSAPSIGVENWHSDLIAKNSGEDLEHLKKFKRLPNGQLERDNLGQVIEKTHYERWEVYNTAIKINDDTGYMAYHENESVKYPDIKDCEGNSIWGVDICGNRLVNNSIRHHRLPDRKLEPHFKNKGTRTTKTLWVINLLVETEEVVDYFTPIDYEITYEVNGQTFTDTINYGNPNQTEAVVFLDDEPENVTATAINNTPENGELTVTITVLQENSVTDNSQNDVIRLIGFDFYNVDYPANDIVGHYFVIADTEKTIISKGYVSNLPRLNRPTTIEGKPDIAYGNPTSPFPNSRRYSGYNAFISPEHQVHSLYPNGEFFKGESLYTFHPLNELRPVDVKEERTFLDQSNFLGSIPDLLFVGATLNFRFNDPVPFRLNTPVSEIASVQPQNRYYTDNNEVISNYTLNQKLLAYKGNHRHRNGSMLYGGMKVEREVYTDLFSIRYRKMHSNPFKKDRNNYVVFGGNTYIGNMKLPFNNFIRFQGNKFLPAILGTLYLLVRLISHTSKAAQEINRIFNDYYRHFGLNFNTPLFQFTKSYTFSTVLAEDLYFESTINVALLAETSNPELDIIKNESTSNYGMLSITTSFPADGGGTHRDIIVNPGLYPLLYNKDYSRLNTFRRYLSLPAFYDYCSKCDNIYPTRAIFSPISLDEDFYDLYRINLANDYKDLPANRGQLLRIFYKKNALIILSEQTAFITKPNPQEIQASDTTLYIGTGSFLSIPSEQFIQSDIGYGGIQNKLSAVNTPAGLAWVSNDLGQVFNFDSKLEELSAKGLEQWSIENLPLNLRRHLSRDYGINLKQNILKGVGSILSYDPRFKRLIMHKKDFKVNPSITTSPNTEGYFLNDKGQVLKVSLNGNSIVPYTDKKAYEDLSFTLSYSYLYQGWTSWHSYMPDFMYFDERHLYSTKSNTVNKHLHNGNFQTYYGKKYPFIIESIYTGFITEDLDSIQYMGYTLFYDTINKTWVDVSDKATFDGIMLYNSSQILPYMPMKLLDQQNMFYNNIDYVAGERNVIRTDENYKISGIFDYSSNSPVLSSSWDVIQEYKDEFGYIDKMPINFDLNKSQYELNNIKGKWVAVRLFFKPEEDYKKILHLQNINKKPSMR